MDCLKFPISYDASGFAKVVEGSTDYYKQLLSICARTEPGISPLFPTFGVFDPTLMVADKGQFVLNAAKFIPEIQIGEVETIFSPEGDSAVAVSFTRRT